MFHWFARFISWCFPVREEVGYVKALKALIPPKKKAEKA